jgi:divalent metal cation (Fe/Co/Zn/Cd) transporter
MESKQAIARASVLASGSLTMLKFLVGFLTGSLGLLAEGAHSLLDLLSTVIPSWWSGSQPCRQIEIIPTDMSGQNT